MAAHFPLGRLVATPGAIDLIRSAGEDLLPALLERHQSGDWGEVPPEDARENQVSAAVFGASTFSSCLEETSEWLPASS